MARRLRCSFCGRDEDRVARLIAGPQVFICDACVAECNAILARHPPPPTGRQAERRSWRRWLRAG
jgi:ATP-dependent protease Clp ATPase subunit